MSDLFGHTDPKAPFVDIRNQRPSVAEEKAQLCLALGELVRKVPQKVAQGSIEQTRTWMATQKASTKTLKNSRSSVNDLQSAIKQMQAWV